MTAAGSAPRTPMGAWRAVVDVGSVSTGLLLSDGEQRLRRSVDTHLGAGALAPNGEIVSAAVPVEAIDHLRSVLAEYRQLADEREAPIRAVGTAAARRATNRSDLDAAVADTLGVSLDVLDSSDEATLAFVGASSGTPAAEPGERAMVTIDVGGGSTEFASGRPGAPAEWWSVPIGGSLIAQTYLAADPPEPEELSAALSVIELHLDDLRREAPALAAAAADPDAAIIGLGGVITIAAVEIGLLDDDPVNGDGDGPLHDLVLERAAVEDVFRTLATESRADRAHNPGLPSSRVDDIVGGCAVLVETMRQFGIDAITVSQRGLADGVLRARDSKLDAAPGLAGNH